MPKTNKITWIENTPYSLYKSKFTTNESPVIVSDNMSGKMHNIPSISTSCKCNPFCFQRQRIAGSICEHCFADKTINHYSALRKNLESNYNLLTDSVLPVDLLPRFKSKVQIVRIESFGDVYNVTQAINYLNIIRVNPHCFFAWWSKNMRIIGIAIELTGGKPDNLNLIESSIFVDKQANKSGEYVDKLFTVYAPETIDANNINVNCGARCCNTCRLCYTKNDTVIVNEKLK